MITRERTRPLRNQSDEVPENEKVFNVVPLHKKCYKEKHRGYKPVSLTSLIVKLLERILRDNIYLHLEGQGLIRDD